MKKEIHLSFEKIPKCFYDSSLNPRDRENELIFELMKIGYYENSEKIEKEESLYSDKDILNEIFTSSEPLIYDKSKNDFFLSEEFKKKGEEELKVRLELEEKRKNDPNRINYDEELRTFLYNKGVKIPNREMDREFYLRERLKPVERKNLLEIIQGFSESMVRERKSIPYAVFGIGTSTYPDNYFSELEKNIFADGFNRDSIVKEKARCIINQGIEFDDYKKYVEYCFNISPAIDEKIKPMPEDKFNKYIEKRQERYDKNKTLGEILDNKGEDLDFAVCLEEIYGESLGDCPSNDYSIYGWNEYSQNIESLQKYFVNFLKKKGYEFKEEIEMLSGADYRKSINGELVREKDILDNNKEVRTYRIFLKEGREMHFYFYNHLADMKVKKEIICNYPFVQIERRVSCEVNLEFGSGKDLEEAIKNGEKTGVFENPLFLKWKNSSK